MGNQKALTAEQSLAARTECSAHTPGPWSLCGDERGGCSCNTVCCADYPIAKVTLGEWGDNYPSVRLVGGSLERKAEAFMERIAYGEVNKETAVANARLIAAAPDLLTALQSLVSNVLDYERVNNLSPKRGRKYCWDSVERAVGVINKATGAA